MSSPEVSVIIPCYNEEGTIQELLGAINAQSMPTGSIEVVIADGMSTDRTRERIQEFSTAHPELSVRVFDNPQRTIPAALNQALRESSGEVITRMDAHAIPAPDYLEKSISALKAGFGDNVGGVIDIHPGRQNWVARAIAVATSHRLGVGDARYRWTTKPTEADTVAFGTYRRELVEKIGGYDETLLVNEDYEFNARIRKAGGKIWVDPAIRAVYYARPDLRSLARQYFSYGFWKFKMLLRYPKTLRWRQALPPLFVSGILMLLLLSTFWFFARIALIIVVVLYLVILLAGSLSHALQKRELGLLVGIPAAIVTMHFSWGCGFLWSAWKWILTGKQHGN